MHLHYPYNNIMLYHAPSIVQCVIGCFVTPWDDPTVPPGLTFPHTDNIKMGKAVLGMVVHPNAKGVSMDAVPNTLEKLAQNGTV